MFTGLVEATGQVVSFRRHGDAGILSVATDLPLAEIALGDSVAVNGACLTVTARDTRALSFDVSPESLTCTTLGALTSGRRVNLERALRLGDRLGGHIVSGHIDCIGRLTRSELRSGNHQLAVTLPGNFSRYLVAKGSITIDGISLTVNEVDGNGFTVNIIPHTYKHTTLSYYSPGDQLNIETDIIGKYVERLVTPWRSSGGVTMKTLAENGFI